jgi:hypothetical protein
MTSFGKLIRSEAVTKINETPIDVFYSTPSADEVESMLKQAAEYQAAKRVIEPKTKER